MTKKEIIYNISEHTGINKSVIYTIVEQLLEEVKGAVIDNDEVTLRQFGTFKQRLFPERYQNIPDGSKYYIPEHYEPSFKPSKEFIQMVRNSPFE